jgi:hypothetical protein
MAKTLGKYLLLAQKISAAAIALWQKKHQNLATFFKLLK